MPRRALNAAVACAVFLSGCREEILHDLDEARANQAVVVLERAGVAVRKSRAGTLWTLSVDESDALDALTVIERSRILTRDLLRHKEESRGFLPSREDRRHSLERRLAWTLETTLERMPLVLEAKVHLRVEDAPAPGAKEETVKSAGVLLVVDGDAPELSARAQELVAAASGLEAGKISVVLTPAPAVQIPLPIEAGVEAPARTALGAGLALCAVALALLLRRARLRRPAPRSQKPLRPASLLSSAEVQ